LGFGAENVSYEQIDVFYLTEQTSLEHPETFSRMEDLKCCHSPQCLHRFVTTAVDPAIGVLVEHVQN
jgi:hypothetical protein